jgi:hypothetical protein
LRPRLAGLGDRVDRVDDNRCADGQARGCDLVSHDVAHRPDRRRGDAASNDRGLDRVDAQQGCPKVLRDLP